MQNLPEFPPLPDCFSHLVINTDGEPQSFHSQFSLSDSMASSFSRFPAKLTGLGKDSLEEFGHYIMNGTRSSVSSLSGYGDTGSDEHINNSISWSINKTNVCPQSSVQDLENTGDDDDDVIENKNPFVKLQSSLKKLQREMKDLRYLDISLFCQLLSLHEAVQEYKSTITDRYSETGSEYSLGTASYMGSMTSLNDDSDWGEDGTILSCDHQDNSDNSQSASSLLKQINELVLRADNDF